jgi:isopenicillin N synthase-like dioxygenase
MAANEYIPLIDLDGARPGSSKRAADVARAIDRACRESGFFVIINHGVPDELIARISTVTLDFFQRSDAWKSRWLADPTRASSRGLFTSAGYVSAAEGVITSPDLCEIYTINRLGEAGVAERAGLGEAVGGWSAPNVWPDDPPQFREIWLDYYAALEALATDLLHLFAIGLGLEPSYFDTLADEHISNLIANFYPPVIEEPLPDQYRKGPHSDWGSLTILHQDGVGGLEVFDQRSGDWIGVPTIPGSFVVNIGDLMSVWTNGQWKSTKHRVRVPPREHWATTRISIPFFHQPNWDALVECLPTCASPDLPAQFEPVTSGQYLMDKLNAAYT